MSPRLIVFGNSGSGKSTLAKALAQRGRLAHLDLDTLAWMSATPPARRPLDEARADLDAFMASAESWVIEGCYADLLEYAASRATAAIWLDLPVEACIANARARPFEPHKYASPEAQDANLPMLIDWIGGYETRDDTLSRRAHQVLFEHFPGEKTVLHSNRASRDVSFADA